MKGMKRVNILLCIMLLFLLTACGKEKVAEPEQSQPQVDRSGYDWRTEPWKEASSADSAHTLYFGQYVEGLEYDMEYYENHSTEYRTWGKRAYALDEYSSWMFNSTERYLEYSYFLNWYDGESGEIQQKQIKLPDLEQYADMELVVSTFDVVDAQNYVLFVQARLEGNTQAYLAVRMDMDGKSTGVTDLYPVMVEHGISLDDYMLFSDVYVDGAGNYYVIPDKWQGTVLVLGADGMLLKRMDAPQGGMVVQYAMKNPDGAPVFEWYNEYEDGVRLATYDKEKGIKVYTDAKLPHTTPKALTDDGYLYYSDNNGRLYRWDLYTGNVEFCIDYVALGIGANEHTTKLITGSAGEPVLLDFSGQGALICNMVTEEVEQKEAIRVVSFTTDCQYVSNCAVEFSRGRTDCILRVESPQVEGTDKLAIISAEEEFRNRMQAELVSGKAADIYIVSASDMKMLYENGVLADLTGVLPEEVESCIFPGVLEGGVIDGQLIGLAPEARAEIMMVSDKYWSEEQWTVEEALSVMESKQALLLPLGILAGNSSMFLRENFLKNLSDTPFLDLEKGVCDVNNPLFLSALKLAKQYGASWGTDPTDTGDSIGFTVDISGYPYFTIIMAEYGEEYHPVGFPSESGSGGYWECDYFVVMNKNSKHKEVLEEFLVTLFDVERQRSSHQPVRNDLVSQFTVYNEDSRNPWQFSMGDGTFAMLEVKPDGSSWEQEYLDLMNSCVCANGGMEVIREIIMEECDGYFYGDKDIQQTVEIIQKRVQLYLDEQN